MAEGKISGEYDFVVVGAGHASMCAALAVREWAGAGQRAPTRCTSSE
jgi:succinate dehydrogenase/fumarate reductase flavoprotein subunit